MNVGMINVLKLTIKEAETRFNLEQKNFLNTSNKKYIRKSRKINFEITKFCRNLITIAKHLNNYRFKSQPFHNLLKKDYLKLVKNAATCKYKLPDHLEKLTNNFIALYFDK